MAKKQFPTKTIESSAGESRPESATMGGIAHSVLFWDSSMEVLRDDEYVIGRDPSCDIVIDDPTVSRRHAILRRYQGTWTIADQGSTAGTIVDDIALARDDGAPIPRGRTELRFGDKSAIFTDASDDVYQKIVVPRLYDSTLRIPKSDVLRADLRSVVLNRRLACLLTFDVDRFQDFVRIHNNETGRDLVRLLFQACINNDSNELQLSATNAYLIHEDALSFLVSLKDSQSYAALGVELTRMFRDVSAAIGQRWSGATISAALTPVTDSANKTLERTQTKLVQAKIAGGNRVASSDVEVLWLRSDMERFFEALPRVGVVIHDAGSPSDVRRRITEVIETMVAGSRASVAWNEGCTVSLVYSSDEKVTRGRKFLRCGPVAVEQLRRIVAQREDSGDSVCHPLHTSLAAYRGFFSSDSRRTQWPPVLFEWTMRMIGCIAVAAAGREAVDNEDAADALAKEFVAHMPRDRPTLGTWRALLSAPSFVRTTARWIPDRVLQAVSSSRTESLVYKRNDVSHRAASGVDDDQSRSDFVEWVASVDNNLSGENWKLVDVGAVLTERSRRRVELRDLTGVRSPRPTEESFDQGGGPDVAGTWLVRDGRWLWLSPFASYQTCKCGAEHLFLAEDPWAMIKRGDVQMTAFFSGDSHEAKRIEVRREVHREAFALLDRSEACGVDGRLTLHGRRSP